MEKKATARIEKGAQEAKGQLKDAQKRVQGAAEDVKGEVKGVQKEVQRGAQDVKGELKDAQKEVQSGAQDVKKDLGEAADSAAREAGADVDAARDTVDLVGLFFWDLNPTFSTSQPFAVSGSAGGGLEQHPHSGKIRAAQWHGDEGKGHVHGRRGV